MIAKLLRQVRRKLSARRFKRRSSASKKLALLAALQVLAGCQTRTPIVVIDTSCTAFEPIRYSRTDTAKTKIQIRAHNAAWDSLCKE